MITFVESPLFTKQVHDYLTDTEYGVFQEYLAANPDMGDVVRGSGGVRKVRWSRRGTDKSGGVRVLYLCPDRGRANLVTSDLCQKCS
ncbi:MAG: type II toxin-antitoxin system RelE/ParE family toxin [Desulfuromonadaceae bacterium]|nr:type II toxin-antitoxin system RelE/ParE family toxin [Desulfuromonadaceae bacterium]